MKSYRFLLCVQLTALGLIVATSTLRAISFTGNVETDFTGAVVVTDAAGDVGVPPGFPVSGWDMKDFRFIYDQNSNSLHVGMNFFGIAGDADGNGDPSNTSSALFNQGGTDVANLGGQEVILIHFDWNSDGKFDVIAGVPRDGDRSTFSIAEDTMGSSFTPITAASISSSRFGTSVAEFGPFVGGTTTAPDFEFTIPNVSSLSGFNAASGFSFEAFAGSFDDAGIGEDLGSGAVQGLVTSVPENGTTILLLGLALAAIALLRQTKLVQAV